MKYKFAFKKFTGEKIEDVVEYAKDWINSHENIEILIGTDSQSRGERTYFSTVIAFYNKGSDGHGHGGHCIYRRWFTKRYNVDQKIERLFKEVVESVELALYFKENGIDVDFIDLDVNPKAGEKQRNKSNATYLSSTGYVTGYGFKCRYKTLGPLVTTMADYIVKH